MRIRKRTPSRAAMPGLASSWSCDPSPPPPPPPPPSQPKVSRRAIQSSHGRGGEEERPPEEQEEEEERKEASLVGAGNCKDDDQVPPAASKNSAMDVLKPELEPAAARITARCNRTDGKKWRCKAATAPGSIFCNRHLAWSAHRRPRPRPAKKNHGGAIPEAATTKEDAAAEEPDEAKNPGCNGVDGDGFYYYGGFQPGCRKRARSSGAGAGPA